MSLRIPTYTSILMAVTLARTDVVSTEIGALPTSDEKKSIQHAILAREARVSNIFVRYEETESNHGVTSRDVVEWAASGEKRYRKRRWATPVDQPPSERWSIAVWDGHFQKRYDSELDNGSIRDQYDPLNPDHALMTTNYHQLLGHFTRGTLGEILSNLSLEQWDVEWVVPGEQVVLRTSNLDGEARLHAWTVDLSRGAMITRYELRVRRGPEKLYQPYVTREVTTSEQVAPGLWFPTASSSRMEIVHPTKGGTLKQDLVVKEILVNDPAVEEKFQFTFPEGAVYYDHILGSSMVAQPSPGKLATSIEALADTIGELVKDSNQPVDPGKDLDTTDRIVGARRTDKPGDSAQAKDVVERHGWAIWLLLGVLPLAALLYWVLRRR